MAYNYPYNFLYCYKFKTQSPESPLGPSMNKIRAKPYRRVVREGVGLLIFESSNYKSNGKETYRIPPLLWQLKFKERTGYCCLLAGVTYDCCSDYEPSTGSWKDRHTSHGDVSHNRGQ